ncbi:hypothetical protein EJ03DRAFT_332430 [Teratosphaeria nubilosa]|uniref:Uncharacterized protein n=1 Tax=Teratosphaeria nubilosa TaxID=161662 RepID=A0A6G1KUN6_9PEZI|nr:hypothetical protein EJ03DRAFT_332430 [Teratosphaeria nubilosa]
MAYNRFATLDWRSGGRGRGFHNTFGRRDSGRSATSSKIQLRESRKKTCPRSPFWSLDFDKQQHDRDFKQQMRDEARAKQVYNADWLDGGRHGTWTIEAISREPFDGQHSNSHVSFSAVLCIPTIFCENWEEAKEYSNTDIAPWPYKTERDYEGDGRIATDRLHGRFPGLPRVEGAMSTWQTNAVIPQYAFDERYFIPQEVDMLLRIHWVEDLEFEDMQTGEVDEEGRFALGESLMEAMGLEGGYKF